MPSVPRDENGSSDHLSRHLGKRAVGPGIHEGQGRRRGRRVAGSCCFSFFLMPRNRTSTKLFFKTALL